MKTWQRMACVVLWAGIGAAARGQQGAAAPPAALGIDAGLWRTIVETPAIDDHAHPMLAPPAMAADREFDALPVDNMAPETDPVGWRPDYPPLAEAWRALFGYDAPSLPLSEGEMAKLNAAREVVRRREGVNYSRWVLDRAGIGTMLANRVAMGTGVERPRFRWVPYIDALLFPLDNSGLSRQTPDQAQFFALEDKVRARYLRESGLPAMPRTLDAYLKQVVLPTLARHKASGAVAEKFEVAYLRGFNFGDPPQAEAAKVYEASLRRGLAPSDADYKLLQDYLFRRIALECGRLGMAVHLHGMAGGGRYFGIAGANPLLLEPILNDSRLAGTNFVLLHGGWPFVREAGAMLQKPNFMLDLSQQALTIPARTLSGSLREWLEMYPDKVLFATDGYPFSPAQGWEEATWIASRNAREALGIALTGMVRDGEVSEARAKEIAVMVLRGNAEKLYGAS